MRKRPTKIQIALLATVTVLLIVAAGAFYGNTVAQTAPPADGSRPVFPPAPQPAAVSDQAHFNPNANFTYVVLVKALTKGAVVSKADIAVRHTNIGEQGEIKSVGQVIGRKARRDLRSGDTLEPGDLENLAPSKKSRH